MVHKRGGFHNLAVALTLIWSLTCVLLGQRGGSWKRGAMVRLSLDDQDILRERLHILLCSTLHSMPLGLKPFGRPRPGLKFLAIKAPPKSVWRHLPAILAGTESQSLETDGYFRRDTERLLIGLRKGFVLDGEHFPGGNLVVERAEPVQFVVP
jgi:hypothetical protein